VSPGRDEQTTLSSLRERPAPLPGTQASAGQPVIGPPAALPAVVVIGTSAGGLVALRTLLVSLPCTLAAPVCVVQHLGRQPSLLPELLAAHCVLPIRFAEDDTPLKPGILVAPPDHHLLLDDGHVRLSRGPRENFSRPSINPTLRSAAQSFGRRAIGVILTGRLDDGTAGLYDLKQAAGIAIVQDPEQAEYAEMPRSALEHVPVDYCLPLEQIGPLLVRLVEQMVVRGGEDAPSSVRAESPMDHDERFDKPAALTCPDCGGATRAHRLGSLIEYRCHIGHRFSLEALTTAQRNALDEAGQRLLRSFGEWIGICDLRAAAGPVADQAEWSAAAANAGQLRALLIDLLDQPV